MATTEHTINDAIAALLRHTRRTWGSTDAVSSENTGMLKGSSKRPDILVLEQNVSPVVIETEVLPAISVQIEAVSRLGQNLKSTGRPLLSAIAVRLPERFRQKSGTSLSLELSEAQDLEFALYTGTSSTDCTRWPSVGWLKGGVLDLSLLAQSASVPPAVIEHAAERLIEGVSEAAYLIDGLDVKYTGALKRISEELLQEDGQQTRRMAATILANAFVFHESLARGPGNLGDVLSLDEIKGDKGHLTKSAVLQEWTKILQVNYWPIFEIARRIVLAIPSNHAVAILEKLAGTAKDLIESNLMRSHDLTGAVFQRLIADRKFLAAYYTTPASAALLISLAITPNGTPNGGSWSNKEKVVALRVADFACGTGTLLSTAYQRIGQLHEIWGGNAELLHPEAMANSLVGCDVLPAAAHLTASMLAGAHPTRTYQKSSILTVPYGKQPGGEIALGSLDLLRPQGLLETHAIVAKSAQATGEVAMETWADLPHESFDLVVMNPPFTRATGHEGKKIGIPNPMFAAFSSSSEEQKLMGKATEALTRNTSAHGNAGEASIFLVVADRKLRANGTLALVMPLSLMSGDAWEQSRALLATHYDDLILVSISGHDGGHLSFSADTEMGECLVVGRKAPFVGIPVEDEYLVKGNKRATFVILNARPAFPLTGTAAAAEILSLIRCGDLRMLEDGPVGGTRIHFGNDLIGHALNAPLPISKPWNISRVSDLALAQTAFQIAQKHLLFLPGMKLQDAVPIPITTITKIATIGPYHMDINAEGSRSTVRGPFKIVPADINSAPTYPVLWAHDAAAERKLEFKADCEGIPKKAQTFEEQKFIDHKVAAIWKTASNCHFNRDFRFNSQSTGMQFTPRQTIGGRAWLSLKLSSPEREAVLVLWGNTSLGLLMHWWHANKQQSGRGSIGKASLEGLPVLDVEKLNDEQMENAGQIFEALKSKDFLPINEMNQDPWRQELDQLFFTLVLQVPFMTIRGGPLELIRSKLAKEPSIHGHKSQ